MIMPAPAQENQALSPALQLDVAAVSFWIIHWELGLAHQSCPLRGTAEAKVRNSGLENDLAPPAQPKPRTTEITHANSFALHRHGPLHM